MGPTGRPAGNWATSDKYIMLGGLFISCVEDIKWWPQYEQAPDKKKTRNKTWKKLPEKVLRYLELGFYGSFFFKEKTLLQPIEPLS